MVRTNKIEKELFVNCPIPMRTLLSTLSDNDVESLHSIVWNEVSKRIDNKIESGTLPALTDEEKALTNGSSTIPAVKAYRDRTKCSLTIAKRMIDYFLSKK